MGIRETLKSTKKYQEDSTHLHRAVTGFICVTAPEAVDEVLRPTTQIYYPAPVSGLTHPIRSNQEIRQHRQSREAVVGKGLAWKQSAPLSDGEEAVVSAERRRGDKLLRTTIGVDIHFDQPQDGADGLSVQSENRRITDVAKIHYNLPGNRASGQHYEPIFSELGSESLLPVDAVRYVRNPEATEAVAKIISALGTLGMTGPQDAQLR